MRLKWTIWDIFYTFSDNETLWDNLEDFTSLEHLDRFPSHFRTFSPIIGSLKKTRDGRTDRPSYRDAWTHLK